jgi:hypothetical protein
MGYVKTIVCFANSRKTSGRCVAGKEWLDGKPGDWVRPIGASPTHELSEEERRFGDGRDPEPLDIIQVPCRKPMPLLHQPENHAIASEPSWKITGKLPWKDVHEWIDRPASLWHLGQHSKSGVNDRVAVNQGITASLYLITPDSLRLLVGPRDPGSRRQVRGAFLYQREAYRLVVTDPVVEKSFLAQEDGEYDVDSPTICVSLGEPLHGFHYKLIASVLNREKAT